MSKTCTKCNVQKSLSDFTIRKERKNTPYNQCKQCRSRSADPERARLRSRQWKEENKEKIKIQRKEYYHQNKERCKEYQENNAERIKEARKARHAANKERNNERSRLYHDEHREELNEYYRQYYQKNKQEIIKRNNARTQERRDTDPVFRLLCNQRHRVYEFINGRGKSATTMELIGCDLDFLRDYLEAEFTPEMNWGNYGSYWHVDHIHPCASFDMTDPAQQKECFHWSNLQPLEAKENIRKGARLDWVQA